MGPSTPTIDALLNAWRDAIRRGDPEVVAGMVTDDAEFWSQGQAPLTGARAVKEAFQALFARFTMDQEFRRDELVVAGDWAFMRGLEANHVVSRATGEEITRRQRAFSVMRRGADGNWRFCRGMTNQPPEES